MSNNTISLTVPMDYNALTRAADMLHGLALDCNGGHDLEFETIDKDKEKQVEKINEDNGITAAPAPAVAEQEASVQTASVTTISGVELDKDGLPWDARIHSASKKKTVKEETWKLKRGADPALVETVKAELKAAMSASPAAPIETAAPAPINTATPPAPTTTAPMIQPPASIAEPLKYVTENGNFTADDLRAANWTDEMIEALPVAEAEPVAPVTTTPMTFPELMAKVTQATTTGTITKAQVDQACIDNGLASLPLLAARPDLIPQVNAKLFG